MSKPIVIFDVETTGLSPQYDWILQLSAIKVDRKTLTIIDKWSHYIKPAGEYTITEPAQVTHGLSREFIEANGESLREIGQSFVDFCEGCDMGGYNSNSFDVKFIYKDLAYSGIFFDFDNRQFYDMCLMERRLHPNNLGAVFARYKGMTMEEFGLAAHDAKSDIVATLEVLKSQLEVHHLTFEEIDQWSENNLTTPDGTLRNIGIHGAPELLVFANGKYKDRDIYEVMKEDAGYLKWWSANVASQYTLKKARAYCKNRLEQESK